jgi:PleD family two-component response regulator
MILAVLDDLMFTSKIRTTASQLGVTVAFARSREGALTALHGERPTLVILDLNSVRVEPIGIVADMKADAALADIATIGFASHVQTAVIEEARAAGVTEVMARSAFTQRLPELLSRDK